MTKIGALAKGTVLCTVPNATIIGRTHFLLPYTNTSLPNPVSGSLIRHVHKHQNAGSLNHTISCWGCRRIWKSSRSQLLQCHLFSPPRARGLPLLDSPSQVFTRNAWHPSPMSPSASLVGPPPRLQPSPLSWTPSPEPSTRRLRPHPSATPQSTPQNTPLDTPHGTPHAPWAQEAGSCAPGTFSPGPTRILQRLLGALERQKERQMGRLKAQAGPLHPGVPL